MEIHSTEQDQIEAIRSFFTKHGTNLLLGLAAAIAVFFGYQAWMSKQQGQAEQASAYYNELRTLAEPGAEMTKESRAQFDDVFGKLVADNPKSIYSSYASLLQAKLNVDEGQLDRAAQALQWVVDAAVTPEIVALANLRLARVAFAKGENDKALKLLDAESAPFASSYEELRGDIYVDMNQHDKALAAYQKAKELKSDDTEAFANRILEMKIDSLVAENNKAATNTQNMPTDNSVDAQKQEEAK